MSQPLLSVVMVGRNDDYGGDFRQRLQLCIGRLCGQLERHAIRSEVIFVNHNPLPAPDIRDFIQWPASTETVKVRVLTVPPEVHRQVVQRSGCRDVPVLEYFAKNAAIRRASGRFILSMNPDILLPDGFFNPEQWDSDAYLRADRVDYSRLDNGLPAGFTRVFLKGRSYPCKDGRLPFMPWLRLRNEALCRYRTFTPRIRVLLDLIRVHVYFHNTEYRCHCNVSGDFLMMARERWHHLHGHSEQTPIALHVDALMVAQTAASGLRERVLRQPIHHLEHTRRYDANEERPEYRAAYLDFQRQAQEMLAGKRSPVVNGEDWGLPTFDLRFSEI